MQVSFNKKYVNGAYLVNDDKLQVNAYIDEFINNINEDSMSVLDFRSVVNYIIRQIIIGIWM